jgi:hypothetical protein
MLPELQGIETPSVTQVKRRNIKILGGVGVGGWGVDRETVLG